MFRELRLALRRLWRQPGFSLLAVVILALGLGAAVAMFSLVNAWVLRALPYPEADRLVRLQLTVAGRPAGFAHTAAAFLAYQRQVPGFESVAGYQVRDALLEQPGQAPVSIWGVDVTADFLRVLQVSPSLGRGFLPDEDRRGGPRVAVVSTRFWQDRLGGDPGIIGRPLRLDGQIHTIVGVMAPAFRNTPRSWVRADVWRLVSFVPAGASNPLGRGLNGIARLKPGVTLAQVDAQLQLAGAQPAVTGSQPVGSVVRPLSERGWDNTGRAAWLTLALAILLVMITCVNLVGLQLARLAARGRDWAIRLALGAGRARLVREALIESLLISLAGGALGLLLADGFTQQLARRMTWGGSRVEFGIALVSPFDPRLLAFTVALVGATALVVGTVPAWLGSSRLVSHSLRHGGRGATGRAHDRLRAAVVVTEMALALVLLAAGGLFVRGLQRLGYSDPGWRFDELLYARIDLPRPGYPDRQSKLVFNQRLQERLRALPMVASSAFTNEAPELPVGELELVVEGGPVPVTGAGPRAYYRNVSPGYFETLGIDLLAGRPVQSTDVDQDQVAVVINDSMARALWPGRSPLGKRVGVGGGGGGPLWGTIVGVVSDVRFPARLTRVSTPYQLYFSMQQGPPLPSSVVVLRPGPGVQPASLGAALVRAVAEIDPALPAIEALTPRMMVERSFANFTAMGWVVFAFAGLGLLLSGLGVYGLFAGLVAERTREIGVRMALGAQAQQVLRLMLAGGLKLAAVGAGLGLLGALFLGPVLTAAVEALPTRDPAVLAGLALVLVAVALVACWLPARRAARVDPMVALRSE